VRQEVAIEEQLDKAEEAPSLEVLEQRKRKRVSEWVETLSQEETERNTNFAPVAGDWRERLARARQRK